MPKRDRATYMRVYRAKTQKSVAPSVEVVVDGGDPLAAELEKALGEQLSHPGPIDANRGEPILAKAAQQVLDDEAKRAPAPRAIDKVQYGPAKADPGSRLKKPKGKAS